MKTVLLQKRETLPLIHCMSVHQVMRREALEMPFMVGALQNELQQNMFSHIHWLLLHSLHFIGYCEVQL